MPQCFSSLLDCSQPEAPTIITEMVEPFGDEAADAPTPVTMPAPPSSIMVEEALALAHLGAEVPRQAVEGHCTPQEPLPRKQRTRYTQNAMC